MWSNKLYVVRLAQCVKFKPESLFENGYVAGEFIDQVYIGKIKIRHKNSWARKVGFKFISLGITMDTFSGNVKEIGETYIQSYTPLNMYFKNPKGNMWFTKKSLLELEKKFNQRLEELRETKQTQGDKDE